MNPFSQYVRKKNQYRFENTWKLDAPIEIIWDELINYKKWSLWCDGLEHIESLAGSKPLQKGNLIRSTWKGPLPYSLTFDSTIEHFLYHSFMSFSVTGDLYGEGQCSFSTSRNFTRINFIWDVSPTKLWIKMSAPFARQVFMENHNHILDQAARGFSRVIENKKQKFYL